MTQTPEGARKVAAKRIGVSYEEYTSRLNAGEQHCTKCKAWKSTQAFGNDKHRSNGLAKICKECRHVKERICLKGRPSSFKGRKHSNVTKKLLSRIKVGFKNLHRIGAKHTPETKGKISAALRISARRGPLAPGYIDGRGKERLGLRSTLEYKRWRQDVYTRDNFTCQACGDARGRNLQAHHIKPFATHPELRLIISNGITLCWDCHDKRHACKIGRRRTRSRGQLAIVF